MSSMIEADLSVTGYVCNLTEVKRKKNAKRSSRLCELLQEAHTSPWAAGKPNQTKTNKAAKQIKAKQNKAKQKNKVVIEGNSKPHGIMNSTDGSVTRHCSGWGLTVKQGPQPNKAHKQTRPTTKQGPQPNKAHSQTRPTAKQGPQPNKANSQARPTAKQGEQPSKAHSQARPTAKQGSLPGMPTVTPSKLNMVVEVVKTTVQ